MYIDYRSHVLSKYKSGCQAQILSLFLRHPTPGNLRSECVSLCKQRYDRKDQQILTMFFGPHESQKACIQAIERFDVEKFKPLLNFITGKTADPEQKNIELLAWLVDVQPRPYQADFPYENVAVDPETVQEGARITADVVEQKQQVSHQPTTLGLLGPQAHRHGISYRQLLLDRRRAIAFALTALVIISGIFWWSNNLHNGGCMYWAGDHYEPVACDRKMSNVLIIAADDKMLRDFKKITREDTITVKALGHVWYSKINNLVEYFTADGYHPVQIHYHLKPLTRYMIEQHIHPGL